MTTKIVNKKYDRYDIYIGRGSAFGNPFKEKEWGRELCIKLYRTYFYHRLIHDEEFKEAVLELKGHTLGCFCKPLECHGDIIVQYLDK